MKKTFLFIMLFAVSMSLWTLENHDWLTEFDWFLSDGRRLVDPSADQIDWIGPRAPLVFFHKFYIPSNSILYQARLRKELFYFRYQTEEKDKLFPDGRIRIEIRDEEPLLLTPLFTLPDENGLVAPLGIYSIPGHPRPKNNP